MFPIRFLNSLRRPTRLVGLAALALTCTSWVLAEPPTVAPGTESTLEQPGKPPSDAVVLFDGTDLSKWAYDTNKPAWKVENGYMEITKGSSGLRTKDSFGSGQYHVEWAAPVPPKGSGQGRGNSGVFPMTFYEVQVLDSYENETYADGQAGGIYGQEPPMVNCCRKPGEFQTYDLIFRRPHFDKEGKLSKPAYLTVFHNGVVIHDDTVLFGRMSNKTRKHYQPHGDALPLALQNHNNPVRYRNIWVRPLADETDPHDTAAALQRWQNEMAEWPWKVNDHDRPRPPVITAGVAGSPPSDARVLFDGADAQAWSGDLAVADGSLKVTGNAQTKESFGDCQLHLEWRSTSPGLAGRPAELALQGRYAVQLGGAVGKQAPLALALREVGQWQSLDVVFRRPTAETPGHVTVLLNGVLCQEAAPLALQGEPMAKAPLEVRATDPNLQLRNLWIRPLPAPGSW